MLKTPFKILINIINLKILQNYLCEHLSVSSHGKLNFSGNLKLLIFFLPSTYNVESTLNVNLVAIYILNFHQCNYT